MHDARYLYHLLNKYPYPSTPAVDGAVMLPLPVHEPVGPVIFPLAVIVGDEILLATDGVVGC